MVWDGLGWFWTRMSTEHRLPQTTHCDHFSIDHLVDDWAQRPRAQRAYAPFFRSPRAKGFAQNWAQLSLLRDVVMTAGEAVQPG
jgi:hypothetical protein